MKILTLILSLFWMAGQSMASEELCEKVVDNELRSMGMGTVNRPASHVSKKQISSGAESGYSFSVPPNRSPMLEVRNVPLALTSERRGIEINVISRDLLGQTVSKRMRLFSNCKLSHVKLVESYSQSDFNQLIVSTGSNQLSWDVDAQQCLERLRNQELGDTDAQSRKITSLCLRYAGLWMESAPARTTALSVEPRVRQSQDSESGR